MKVDLVAALFVAAGLLAAGAFVAAWRRDAIAALAGIPIMFAGAGVAFVAVARFSARAAPAVQSPSTHVVVGVSGPPLGQEAAVLFAVAALALVVLGVALAARAARVTAAPGEGRR
jgi:NADH:ubiquinone oxidoreductase subunit K